MADADEIVERILKASNHFEVFDIPPVPASAAVIKQLYRRLALRCHPDKCKHAEATAAFKKLTAANEVLSDARAAKLHVGEVHDANRDAKVAQASDMCCFYMPAQWAML